jgi:hypothetical protein
MTFQPRRDKKPWRDAQGTGETAWFTWLGPKDIEEPGNFITDVPLASGNLFFYMNSKMGKVQIWMYCKVSPSGEGIWENITKNWDADDGSVRHPDLPDRVLSRWASGTKPSFILFASFKKKKNLEKQAPTSDGAEY